MSGEWRMHLARYQVWAAVLLAPLAANLVIWRVLVVPQQATWQAWSRAQSFAQLKPDLDGLLADSRLLQQEWSRQERGLSADDPAAVMQALEQLAARHRVRVEGMETEKSSAGGSTVSLELKATGDFGKLAHWISEVEGQPVFQVDAWTLTPSTTPGAPHQLDLHLTAWVQQAS